MREIEAEGKTVTLAVESGLADLGLRRDQVEVQVLQEPIPGFLGMGTKLARVRIREKIWGESSPNQDLANESAEEEAAAPSVSPRNSNALRDNSPYAASHSPRRKPAPPKSRGPEGRTRSLARPHPRPSSAPSKVIVPPPADTAKACAEAKLVIEEILPIVGVTPTSVTTTWDEHQVRVLANVETGDSEFLLSQEGKTLEALQFVVTLTLSRRMQTPVAVQVEIGNYWQQKEEEIILQVHQAMEVVKRTQESVRLKPMDSVMRRLVHRTLANHPEIETISEGEGNWRKVVLKPRRK